ncbi:MAG: formyltransferase family protein [Alphaproteobacteria bacterium]
MKFVYCGYDFMLGIVRRLVEDGHEPVGLFTFPCDNVFNFNHETEAFGKKFDLPVHFEKPRPEDVSAMIGKGAEVFIAAGYLYKIPDTAPAYGINVHPAFLPKGRGLMPLPFILLDHPDAAGLTIHKLANKLDGGDIIAQEKLPLSENESVETLSGRIALRAPELLSEIMKDLPCHWNASKKQDESAASEFPPPGDQMRLLDWNLPIERLDKIARAFGHYGSLAVIDGHVHAVYSHGIKKEKHAMPPGGIASRNNDEITVAANGGLFIIKKSEILPG